MVSHGAKEAAHQLRVLAALPEEPGWVPQNSL